MGSAPSKTEARVLPAARAPQVVVTNPAGQAGQIKKVQTKEERINLARDLSKDRESDEFHNICMKVFQNADTDGNGMLDRQEFIAVMKSPSLGLNLSPSEIEQVYELIDKDHDTNIMYAEFVPVLKKLLQRVYMQISLDWNDWCQISDGSNGKPLYLNKRTGEFKISKPQNFNPERKEVRTFEYVILSDGTEVTTYVDGEGKRVFLNWDDQTWQLFPAEWNYALPDYKAHRTSDPHGPGELELEPELIDDFDQDGAADYYDHPTRGRLQVYMYDNNRRTRLYYESDTQEWNRMPLSWERNMPSVQEMLQAIDDALPEWQNVNEQLLVLRECDYNVGDAILFGEINLRDTWIVFSEPEAEATPTTPVVDPVADFVPAPSLIQPERQLSAQFSRKGSASARQSIRKPGSAEPELSFTTTFRRLPTSKLGAMHEDSAGGPLTVAASARIHELETKLAARDKEVEELRKLLTAQEATLTNSFVREKTVIEHSIKRKDKDNADAIERIGKLSRTIQEQQIRIEQLQNDLIEANSKDAKIKLLEDQLGSFQKSNQTALSTALASTNAKLDAIQAENVVLQNQVIGLNRKLKSPLSIPDVQRVLASLHKQVKTFDSYRDYLTSSVQKQNELAQKQFRDLGDVISRLTRVYSTQVGELTAKYRAESLQRKLLYNKVQELRGNIRVFCRTRADDRGKCVFEYPASTELLVPGLQGGTKLLEFDVVYPPNATQREVFEDTKSTIMSVIDGYNVCLIAYGQTGSGKTHTMTGTKEMPGVNRNAITELLQLVKTNADIDFKIKVSLLEIYNENIFDLLTSDRDSKLSIHQAVDGSTQVAGLTLKDIASVEDIEQLMALGDAHRSVAATKMNSASSRSHAMMQIHVTGFNKISKITSYGKLSLVDLAGSERVSKSEATGQRLLEAAAINKSLTALGQVFKALATSAGHIPYRNSKLTHVLQDSLGGDSKTCVFVNISPLETNLSETICTLNFGQNIRKIELGPAVKHRAPLAPPRDEQAAVRDERDKRASRA
eukprot:m.285581 g.285581  ORF g.285581 m.285581 type:complete len:1019 (+) comp54976_c1_seq2:150-3206(+)